MWPTHPRAQGRVRLLEEVPQALLNLAECAGAEELRLLHLLDPVDAEQLPALVVPLLAARL